MNKIIGIVTLMLLPILLIATTWTVRQDGTGNFTTIAAALAHPSVVNGNIIVIYEGIYTENITVSKNVTLMSRGSSYISTTIIDGSNNPSNPTVAISSLTNATIKYLTITDGHSGVRILNNSSVIDCCVLEDNGNGVSIEEGTLTYCNPIIQDCEIKNNTYNGIISEYLTEPNIISNEIYSNGGHGIYLNGVAVDANVNAEITNNEIFDNNFSGIYCRYAYVDAYGNLIYENTNGIKPFEESTVDVEKCTITNNDYGFRFIDYYANTNSVTVLNSIIYGNTYFTNGNKTTVISPINYSCFETQAYTYTATVSIHTNPLFENAASNDYSLIWNSTQKSPCIDTGDPNSPHDPDETRADMGAIYKEHIIKEYEFIEPGAQEEWNWLCFDILDIYDPTVTNQIQSLLDPIKLDLELGKQENLEFSYNPPNWQNGDEVIYSPLGFKILMEEASSFEVSGFRYPYNTTFTVYANSTIGDWIGYFVGKTQHVYDAFDGYLGNIYEIKHKDWSIRSESGVGGWPDVPYTLSPGDMVVVKCEEDITNFCWVNQAETEKHTEPEAQYFSYSEESDYIPIYVELDETNLPDEVGVIVEGECKGAKVVDDEFIDICSYITETQTGIVELEFSYGSRGVNTKYDEYILFEPDTGNRELSVIDLSNKQDHYYVSFKSFNDETSSIPERLTASNYPNPFNPNTTISYSLPVDGKIEISIYNMKGQFVIQLVSGSQTEGHYEVVWNGNDNAGKRVSSGIYYYQIKACDKIINKKMIMLK